MLPVIVGVSGYSRTIVARMIPSRAAHDILLGHLACLLELGGVARKGVSDNEAALVSRHNGKATLNPPLQRFRGTLGMGVIGHIVAGQWFERMSRAGFTGVTVCLTSCLAPPSSSDRTRAVVPTTTCLRARRPAALRR
jgi:hypothetical protein